MQKFIEFITSKGFTQETFDALAPEEQLKLQNEYNAVLKAAFEAAIEAKASKENLDEFKEGITKSNDHVVKTIEALALSIKAMQEKGGVNPEQMDKSELIELFEKQSKNFTNLGAGKAESMKARMKSADIFSEINKAAALMTTANIIGVGSGASGGNPGQWSPLFGNYVDNTIYSAPKLVSSIMDDISVTFQPGTENIYWTDRVNEEGDAAWLAEGGVKPLIDAEWKTMTAVTREVAEYWKVTTRFLFHARMAVNDFAIHARELIDNKLADGFLLGDDNTLSSNEMNGVITAASVWITPPAGPLLNSTPCPNVYDAILAAATQIRSRGFTGRLIARVSGSLSYGLKTAKDSKGGYLVVPFASADGSQVDEVTVKFDWKLPAGSILIGTLSNYKAVISEEAIFDEGHEGEDFKKNLISRKLETFAQGYLPSSLTGSIIYATLAEILSDIDNGDDCCCTPPVV